MKNRPISPNVSRKEIIQRELAWHESQAHRRYTLDSLLYNPPAFEALIAATLQFLGPESGDIVLDVGCGEGREIGILVSLGMTVIGTDLSLAQLRRARQMIKRKHPEANLLLVQANAEEMPFADNTFTLIHGKAIIHHLDIDRAAAVIRRLLAPGGRAAIAEPLDRHPLFWLGRRLTPRMRTADERPLSLDQLNRLARSFDRPDIETFYLLSPLAYVLRVLPGGETLFRKLHSFLVRIDRWLLDRLPGLNRVAWYGLARLRIESG